MAAQSQSITAEDLLRIPSPSIARGLDPAST
jgi:hypothetical protein